MSSELLRIDEKWSVEYDPSNNDKPGRTLRYGKVVVAEGIAEIAWNYGQRNRELHDEILKKIRTEFWPEWMPEGGGNG